MPTTVPSWATRLPMIRRQGASPDSRRLRQVAVDVNVSVVRFWEVEVVLGGSPAIQTMNSPHAPACQYPGCALTTRGQQHRSLPRGRARCQTSAKNRFLVASSAARSGPLNNESGWRLGSSAISGKARARRASASGPVARYSSLNHWLKVCSRPA